VLNEPDERELIKASAALEHERALAQERLQTLSSAQERLSESFKALSADALQASIKQLSEMANAQLRAVQVQAKGDLDKRQQAVERLVAPLKEQLGRVDGQLLRLDQERRESRGRLESQLAFDVLAEELASFSALGLAAAYVLWRRGDRFAGGAVLAASAAVAKPHLAIGLAALLVGWRDRRVLAGAAAGLAAVLLVSLLAVGPSGLGGFVDAARADSGRWPLASMLGFTGLFGSWLGDGAATELLAATGSVLALGGCLLLGRRLARDHAALEPCLAAATVLSLLASPHLLSHDLVLLAPVLVGLLGWAAIRDGAMRWPGHHSRGVLAGWVVLSLAIALDLGSQAAAPPGRLVPWALLGLAGLLTLDLRPRPGRLATAPT